MANTVSLLSFTNTFGDMMARINSLAQENNTLAANSYTKSTGTLFLNDPTRGLSVSSNASVGGTFTVSGLGSSILVQNGVVANTVTANTLTVTSTSTGQLLVGGGSSGTVKSLANTGTAGVYGRANTVAVITTDGYGRVSGATNTAIAIDASQITTGTLPVARGGTGVTTSTGTGNAVLSTSPTLTTPTISGHLTLEGVTTTGNTGVGKLVFDTNPVLVNPTLGTPVSGNFSTGTFTWPTFNQNTTGTASNITDYSINQNLSTTSTPTFDKVYTTSSGLGTNLKIGDDAWIGDINLANGFRITGAQDPTQGYICFGNGDTNNLGRSGTGPLTYSGDFAVAGQFNLNGEINMTDGGYKTRYIDHYGTLVFRYSDNSSFFWDRLYLNADGSVYAPGSFTAGGDITAGGNVTAYSDRRVKDNLSIIPDALKKVNSLNGYTYTRIDQEDKDKRYTGVVAQEVLEVLPEVVSEDKDGNYSVAYGNMVGILIEAIKELTQEVESLKKKLGE